MRKIQIRSSSIVSGKSKAFTLIEVIFALAIGMIIILVLGQLFKGSLDFAKAYDESYKSGSNRLYVFEGIYDEVVLADNLLPGAITTEYTEDGPITGRNRGQLRLRLRLKRGEETSLIDESENNLENIDPGTYYYKYIQYSLNNGCLQRSCLNTTVKTDTPNFFGPKVGKNLLLYNVDKFSYNLDGRLLILHWTIEGKPYYQYINLRGDKI